MTDSGEKRRVCALEGCDETFVPPPQARHKRYCSERHQRIAEKRRYRERHTEIVNCKRCGERFERSTTTNRPKDYCSKRCQRLYRSFTYRQRYDIQAGVRRARAARWPTPSDGSDSDRRGKALGMCTDSGFDAEGGDDA